MLVLDVSLFFAILVWANWIRSR